MEYFILNLRKKLHKFSEFNKRIKLCFTTYLYVKFTCYVGRTFSNATSTVLRAKSPAATGSMRWFMCTLIIFGYKYAAKGMQNISRNIMRKQ